MRPLLRGELEDPRPLNTRRPEKIAQLLELGLTLAGQAADQRGAQHQTGEPRTQLIQQGHNLRLAATAVHGPQNAVVDMLEGDIDITEDLRLGCDDVNQRVIQLVGV